MKKGASLMMGAVVGAGVLSACGGGSSDGTVTASSDTRPPTLVSTTPAQNATQVSSSVTVTSTWSKALAPAATCQITPALTGVVCRATVSGDGRTVSASNDGANLAFAAGATYSVQFSVRDQAGNPASSTVTFTTAPAAAASCPRATLDDVWINNRLGCLSAGQQFVDLSGRATGTKADIAYIVSQLVVDSAFYNVLGGNNRRYFSHFLCVRNVPSDVRRVSLAADLQIAIGVSNQSSLKPPGVGAVNLDISGGNQPSLLVTSCDPLRHPVIVNYDTGRIESVNPAALSALSIYSM